MIGGTSGSDRMKKQKKNMTLIVEQKERLKDVTKVARGSKTIIYEDLNGSFFDWEENVLHLKLQQKKRRSGVNLA